MQNEASPLRYSVEVYYYCTVPEGEPEYSAQSGVGASAYRTVDRVRNVVHVNNGSSGVFILNNLLFRVGHK